MIDNFTHLAPQDGRADLAVEQSVLGVLLQFSDAPETIDVYATLAPEDFYAVKHRLIYAAIVGIVQSGKPRRYADGNARLARVGQAGRMRRGVLHFGADGARYRRFARRAVGAVAERIRDTAKRAYGFARSFWQSATTAKRTCSTWSKRSKPKRAQCWKARTFRRRRIARSAICSPIICRSWTNGRRTTSRAAFLPAWVFWIISCTALSLGACTS
jgi:hypothetical protein